MIRLTEFLLLIAPFAAYIAWRSLAPGRLPPIGAIIGAGVLLAILAGLLVWLRFEDAVPRDAVYIPGHIENGRIVPERHVP